MENFTRKVTILGDSGVGKTSLVRAISGEKFKGAYFKTLGVNVEPVRVGRRFQHLVFNMWDCAGDPKFEGLGTQYYTQSDAFLICFDLTSKVTLTHCRGWIEKAKSVGLGNKLFILVGLKLDSQDAQSCDDIALTMYPNLHYHEVSNKNGKGIQELISFLQLKLANPKSNL